MKVDPWPKLDTGGGLEQAEREWLLTNGAGAYSMSTVALMHTRRYHGLLVAALKPPLDRHVILSHLETTVTSGSRVYRLSTHQFPNMAPTPGYRFLRHFAQDPLPRWQFELADERLERVVCLARGRNVLVVVHTWHGRTPVTLSARPLMPMRPLHQLSHEHGGIAHDVSLRPGQVRIRPVSELPPVVFSQPGVFVGSPDWWRRFEYAEDRKRDAKHQEDMWTPGAFEIELTPGEPSYLTVALGELPEETPAEILEHSRQHWLSLDPGTRHSLVARSLCVAAEHYRVDHGEQPSVVAGYPWLSVMTRDTLIALPGLFLAQGYFERAERVLRRVIALLKDGLLARGMREDGTVFDQPCADSTLWLFEITRLIADQRGASDELVREALYPALKRIFQRVVDGPQEVVWLTEQGLVASVLPDVALTWMDSRAQGQLVTPRHGATVELQALWARGTETLAALAHAFGEAEVENRAREASRQTRAAFKAQFWCEATGYPFDFLPVPGIASLDADLSDAIRPNAVLALALDPGLFERWQALAIVKQARERLLTPRGLRTLDPHHPRYIGHFEGPMAARRAAYHQGVVWVYLLGAFARAALALHPDDFELQMELKHAVEKAAQSGPLLGHVPQVASGDSPHQFGGCPGQAWSAAELLRTLIVDLAL